MSCSHVSLVGHGQGGRGRQKNRGKPASSSQICIRPNICILGSDFCWDFARGQLVLPAGKRPFATAWAWLCWESWGKSNKEERGPWVGSISLGEPMSQQHFHWATTPTVGLLNLKALPYLNGLNQASPWQGVGFQAVEKSSPCHELREPSTVRSKAAWMRRLQNYKLLLAKYVAATSTLKQTLVWPPVSLCLCKVSGWSAKKWKRRYRMKNLNKTCRLKICVCMLAEEIVAIL